MANPAQELLNAGAVPAGWSAINVGAGTAGVDGASAGISQGRTTSPDGSSNQTYLQGPLISGDFDIAFCLSGGDGLGNGGEVRLHCGLWLASDLSRYLTLGWLFAQGYYGFVDGNLGSVVSTFPARRLGRALDSGYERLRFVRVGGAYTAFVWLHGAWVAIGLPATWSGVTGDVRPRFGIQYCPSGAGVALCRGVIPLVAGAVAVPAAPTGGKAANAPTSDDLDLGCFATWDAVSNIARTFEAESDFVNTFNSVNLRPHPVIVMDGQKPRVSRGGVSVGQTVYFRSRFVDEFGQISAWSTTVSAIASLTPLTSPSYIHPAGPFTLAAHQFTL